MRRRNKPLPAGRRFRTARSSVGGVEPFAATCSNALEHFETPRADGAGRPPSHGRRSARSCPVALGDQVERVAQMEAGDRAARALEQAVAGRARRRSRPVQPVLQARGDDADHALVEVVVEDGDRGSAVARRRSAVEQRLSACRCIVRLDLAPLAVDGVELLGEFARRGRRRRWSGIRCRASCRPGGRRRSGAGRARSRSRRRWPGAASRPATREQCGDARLHAAGAHPLQALRHQAAVVGVEPDHVGDGAQRDQVEQRVQPAAACRASNAPRRRSSARSASST